MSRGSIYHSAHRQHLIALLGIFSSLPEWSMDQDPELHWELVRNAVTGPSPDLLNQKLHFNRIFK